MSFNLVNFQRNSIEPSNHARLESRLRHKWHTYDINEFPSKHFYSALCKRRKIAKWSVTGKFIRQRCENVTGAALHWWTRDRKCTAWRYRKRRGSTERLGLRHGAGDTGNKRQRHVVVVDLRLYHVQRAALCSPNADKPQTTRRPSCRCAWVVAKALDSHLRLRTCLPDVIHTARFKTYTVTIVIYWNNEIMSLRMKLFVDELSYITRNIQIWQIIISISADKSLSYNIPFLTLALKW